MSRLKPAVDYRGFRLSKLNSPEYCHLKLLIFWPIYGALFWFVERVYHPEAYYAMYCALDDAIPFCEYFLIPYLFWFIFLAGGLAYGLLFNPEGFRKMMRFIILTYSTALAVYFIFPNCQELRPAALERENLFTEFIKGFYRFDTNTNVCPSIHVLGTVAAAQLFWQDERLKGVGWKALNLIISLSICASTVFMKQHSVLDVIAAGVVSLAAYPLCCRERRSSCKTAVRTGRRPVRERF